jgi:hypothetical protein
VVSRLGSRRVVAYLFLGALLAISALGFIPFAHGLVTLNPGLVPNTSGGGTQYPSQPHVYYANGYWWAFYGSLGGSNGIYYESSANGVTWSTPVTFTNPGSSNPNGAGTFSTYLVGNTLYYVVAPKSGGSNFWFGAATLQNTGVVAFVAQDYSHSLAAGRIGTASLHSTIMVDGNNYLTIAVTTSNAAANTFYVDVFQCDTVITSCNPGTWYTEEYTLTTASVNDLTQPTLFALTNAGTYYDALGYDNAVSAGASAGNGPFDIFIGASTAASLALPGAATCSPAGQFYNDVNYGATSSGNTIYIVDTSFGGGTFSWNCPVGGPNSAETAISASTFTVSLGFQGSTLVAGYATGSNIQTYTTVNGGTTWAAGPDVAQNTETNPPFGNSPSGVNVSPTSYLIGGQQYTGFLWIDGNYIRFSTLSLTNFAVTVNIALTEYQIPQTAWYPLTPSNEFQISYTQCTNAACSTTAAASVFYGSCSALQGSCTTATPAYGCASGATAGCYITIPNVESYTALTIAAKSTGSTASEEWCLNISNANNGACAATVIGASDGIPATVTVGAAGSNNFVSFVYYDLLANPTYYSVVPASPSPPSVPVIHEITASATSVSSFNPATYNNNMPAASTTQWLAKNSTDFSSASIAGTSSDQWAANPNNLAWTVTTHNQINPDIVYYHQFLNTFEIIDGNDPTCTAGGQFFDGTGQWVLTGTLYGASTSVATYIPSGVCTYPTSEIWTDAAQTVTFPTVAANSPAATRWQGASGSTFVTPSITSGANTYTVTYWKQFEEPAAYSTNDGSTPHTIPTITYSSYGVVAPVALTTTTVNLWMDASTTACVPVSIAGGAGERWNAIPLTPTVAACSPNTGWTISGPNLTEDPATTSTVEYFHQYSQQLLYSTSDFSVPLTVPAITYSSYGTIKAHNLNTTANTDWLDTTYQANVPATIAGAAGEQWSTPTSAWTISGQNVVTNPIAYQHQYQVSFAVSLPGTGVVNPSGTNVWEPATSVVHGVSPISIAGTPISGYSFTTWTASGAGITFAAPTSASTTATLNGPGTITANFQIISGLSFVETGIALDGVHSWTVTLTSWPAAYVGLTTLSASTQAIVVANAPLGTYVYTVPSPQSWGAGTQYVVTAGASGTSTLTMSNPSTTDSVTFQAQYFLSLLQNPANSGTVTANGNQANAWYNSGTAVTLVATPNIGITFSTWSGITCNPGCGAATNNIVMTGPITATANFIVPLSIGICNPETAGVGTAVNCTVTATGGSGTINLTNGAVPSGITVSYTSNGFPASATGASSSMIVTIAPNAPFGVYTWSVTATDEPNGLQAMTTYQISVISPSVTTIGFTTSAYAITYGSQSALFFANNHWFVIYSDGTNLIYRSSTDATGDSWNPQSVITNGVTEGYSFAAGSYGNNVYLALMTSANTQGFYYVQGTVVGSAITWTACASNCRLGPVQMQLLTINSAYSAQGSPDLFVDTSTGAGGCTIISSTGTCIWVTVPALDSNLMWHVEVFSLTNSWTGPPGSSAAATTAGDDVPLHQVYTGPDSQVHSELYAMPDAVAAIFTVGNTPDLPHISVYTHGDGFQGTFCVGGEVSAGACPAPPASWTSPAVLIYEQQSQGAVLPAASPTDVIFFAALAQVGAAGSGASVVLYDFNYNSATPASSTFSGPTVLNAITTIPQNAVVNHSWHLSMTFGGGSLYLAYGIDDDLAFQVGTVGSAPGYSITWSQQIQVPGVVGLVGGVTIAYSGNTVGLVWVQTSGSEYAVKFAVI